MELDSISLGSESGSGSGSDDDGVRVRDIERSEDEVRACSESEGSVDRAGKVDENLEVERYNVSNYNSLLSEFDDYVANEKIGTMSSRASNLGFELGDMVWGKVKSHPWWPGHVYNEAFASSSVRRTKRTGHVLVAFYGDSSYGWFDPAELILFEPHYAEKSQQINSRNFVRAVEEALDEASRRCGLGLTCKCRNPYNFRPSSVKGYVSVDVADYEPGSVYPINQIKKARDNFEPNLTLLFIKQLALEPLGSDLKTIQFIKNKSTVVALRKALFEEFDETYAQAFGMSSSRQDSATRVPNLPLKRQPRAPLSGPLVIAEALREGGNQKKAMKKKDKSKKDKYLFKRRDERSEFRTSQISEGKAISTDSPLHSEGSSPVGYVLQKREIPSQDPKKFEQAGSVNVEAAFTDQASVYSSTYKTNGNAQDEKPNLDKEKGLLQEKVVQDVATPVTNSSTRPGIREGGAEIHLKYEESGKFSESNEGFQQSGPTSSARVESDQVFDQTREGLMETHPSPIEAKPSNVVKKKKLLKRPLGESSPESSASHEKKKKRKKKEPRTESNSSEHPPMKSLVSVKDGVAEISAQSPSHHAVVSRKDSWVNPQKKDVGSTTLLNSGTSPTIDEGINDNLPQLLSDLHALALDPFHGIERNCPVIIMNYFLHFRSIVYQKSLVMSPQSESGNHTGDHVRDLKPLKSAGRPVDPTKAGRKRLPSDRQEEIAAKRLKKINQLKLLAQEKKTSQKTPDALKSESKEQASSTVPGKSIKPVSSLKKMDPPAAKVVEPTMLIMKFPQDTSLPSVAQLKARFGRFGSLDQSAIRVFWKSFTCRVVFMHKADAHAAYRYANGNNSLFGNASVRYLLRRLESQATDGPESNISKGDDTTSNESSLKIREPVVGRVATTTSHHPSLQIKSILKKQTGDDTMQVNGGNNNNNSSRGTARVKFLLGGEETSKEEQQLMIGNRNNFNVNVKNTSFTEISATATSSSSSSVAIMEFNSKNFQKINSSSSSSSLPPILPPPQPPQFSSNMHQTEIALPRTFHHVVDTQPDTQQPSSSSSTIDISDQMVNLLKRCNDVVVNVAGLLGYMPYHSL